MVTQKEDEISPFLCVSRNRARGQTDTSDWMEMAGWEQGEEARWVSAACGETQAAVGQGRTGCGGDGKGPWQGWQLSREPKALCPWLRHASLPPRALRRPVVLRHWGSHRLPAHPQEGWELSPHWPSLSITHPTSHCPRKSPEQRLRDRICLARGWGSGLHLSPLPSTPRVFSASEKHSLCYLPSWPPILCSNESLGRLCS